MVWWPGLDFQQEGKVEYFAGQSNVISPIVPWRGHCLLEGPTKPWGIIVTLWDHIAVRPWLCTFEMARGLIMCSPSAEQAIRVLGHVIHQPVVCLEALVSQHSQVQISRPLSNSMGLCI